MRAIAIMAHIEHHNGYQMENYLPSPFIYSMLKIFVHLLLKCHVTPPMKFVNSKITVFASVVVSLLGRDRGK